MWRTCAIALHVCSFTLLFADGKQSHHDYCIIGAGPAGLQLGYFMKRSNRDYVVFEKSDKAGDFFTTYPRHRKLISINKRFTGRLNKEFNLRHDWNSLISDDDQLLFTKYSEKYFPSADEMLKYLADFHKKLDINVKFNTDISNISKSRSDSCKYTMKDQRGNDYCCRLNVIIATGIASPKMSYGIGHEMVEGYETMSIDPKDYEGQAVLLFGRGNSAMETAISLYGHTAHLTLAARSRVTFSWDTHYVGDI
uniref:Uncharacterized protein n=1 Tax=Plectus sambesii TaxID=2011161 RepID=A0A914WN39_9BILA